jgi:hypothetical protein
VVDSGSDADLSGIAVELRDSPAFLAGWLDGTPAADQLLARLGLDQAGRDRLLVCRTPRPDHFAADVEAIAGYLGVDALALAMVLREAATLAALAGRGPGEQAVGLLAAARDTAEEQLPRSLGADRLRRLAEATWAATPPAAREAHDVEAAVAWSSPVAVVSLPRLALPSANAWLDAHGIPRLGGGIDGPLHGLLVAWRGNGIIFVDGTLGAVERRFVVAHEHGHFLLDYLEPRRRVLVDAPELLAVIDGHRAPTSADRARAVLARVPLGLHTHLLERDAAGGASHEVVAAEDAASLYALELLTPWDAVLERVRALLPGDQRYPRLLEVAAETVAREFALPADPAASRAAAALEALGVRRRFFDR